MNRKPSFSILILSLLAVSAGYLTISVHAQSPQNTPAPANTAISPTSDLGLVLRATIEAQKAEMDLLQKNLELTQRELSVARAEINNDISTRFLPFTIVGVIIAAIGLTSIVSMITKLRQVENSLVAKIEESLAQKSIRLQETLTSKLEEDLGKEVQIQIAERLQQIDPTNTPIHLPQDLKKEHERLMRFGFRKFNYYEKLDSSCLTGCVIVHVNQENMKDLVVVKEFRAFVLANKPDPDKVGFLFYSTSNQPFPNELLSEHPVADYSTSITTLGSNVMLIMRNLIR